MVVLKQFLHIAYSVSLASPYAYELGTNTENRSPELRLTIVKRLE